MKKTLTYLILIIALVISLFPFYFMFISAGNSNNEILRSPPSLTYGPYIKDNLIALNGKINLLRVIFNSLFITGSYTILSILIHSMAGFALSKYHFRMKNVFFAIIMTTMMIPAQVLYVPLFTLMNRIGWVNSYQAVILPTLANAFGIFLMRQNMLSFPDALMEAARIDGYSEFSIFFQIVLPNMKSALGALGIYMFLSMWNSFMWPLIIMSTKNMYNFPVALSMLDGNIWQKNYGVIMLATSIATLPILVIFLILQNQFISGVMGGAVKE